MTLTTLDTRAGFIRAICENPADDALRLVFSDWLEENGEAERAEFVRVQCRLVEGCRVCDGTGRNVMSPCPCSLLRRREQELFSSDKIGKMLPWTVGAWLTIGNPGKNKVGKLRRGFVQQFNCSTADWLSHGPAIVVVQPVEVVELTDREPSHDGHSWIWWDAVDDHDPADGPFNWNGWLANAVVPLAWRPFLLGKADYYINGLYSNRERAVAAMSDAAIAWARREAGLPPLTSP